MPAALIVYLFVNAPPPLPQNEASGVMISIEQAFAIVEAENDLVRALWTREIVGAGKKVGLKFDEDWRDPGIEAGPLPALFLRETAKSLEKQPVRLSLFLGSDYPISDANRFRGLQMEKFELIRSTHTPQFFFAPDTGLHPAMFSDIALADACVSCHNGHRQSPKTDWKLNDVMGATTWMYPEDEISLDELIRIVTALRQGYRDAYSGYVNKAQTFANPPVIGNRWPREGYFLPSVKVFMAEAARHASSETLAAIAGAVVTRHRFSRAIGAAT
ncbi:MAG: c-type heme family protein [Gammaproteobacteria bacterium]